LYYYIILKDLYRVERGEL